MGHNHEECGDGVWEAKQKQWGSWMLAQRKEEVPGMQEEGRAARGGRARGQGRTGGRGRFDPNSRQKLPIRKRSSEEAGMDSGQGEEEDVTSPLKSNMMGGEVQDNAPVARRNLSLALSTSFDQQNLGANSAASGTLRLARAKHAAGEGAAADIQSGETRPPPPAYISPREQRS
ncbi:hypothetical protein D1007_46663 [Hordeum vulgare]|nr:hypothetical protein D1007_46663 [Hordeum vulgare]